MYSTGNRALSSTSLRQPVGRDSLMDSSAWAPAAVMVPITGAAALVDTRAQVALKNQLDLAVMTAGDDITCRAAALLGSLNRDPYGSLIASGPSSGIFNQSRASELLQGIASTLGSVSRSDFATAAIAAAVAGALASASASSTAVATILSLISGQDPQGALDLVKLASVIVEASGSVFDLARDCIQLAADGLLFAGPELADMISGQLGALIMEAGVGAINDAIADLTKSIPLPAWAKDALGVLGVSVVMPVAVTAEGIAKAMSSLSFGNTAKAVAQAVGKALGSIAKTISAAIGKVADAIAGAAKAIGGAIGALSKLSAGNLLALASRVAGGLVTKRSDWNALLGDIRAILGVYPARSSQEVSAAEAQALTLVGVLADILAALGGRGGKVTGSAYNQGSAVVSVLEALGRGSTNSSTILAAAQAALAAAQAAMGTGGRLPDIDLPGIEEILELALQALAASCGMHSSLGSFLSYLLAWIQQLIASGATTLPAELLEAVSGAVDSSECRAADASSWSSGLSGLSGLLSGQGGSGSVAAGLAQIFGGHECQGEGLGAAAGAC